MVMNTGDDVPRLTEAEALQVWKKGRAEDLGKWIAKAIRRMGLTPPKEQSVKDSDLDARPRGRRGPSAWAARQAMAADDCLADAIVDASEAAFFVAVRRGGVYAGDQARGCLYRIVERTTWRLATKRGAVLMATVGATRREAERREEPTDKVPSELPLPDEAVDRRDALVRLRSVLAGLTPEERDLLDAKVEGDYAALASRLGVKVTALRTRACRLMEKIRTEIPE